MHHRELRERVSKQLAIALCGLVAAASVGSCHAHSPAFEGVDLLVVATHPDDEVIMAGALIAQARARGESVVVAVLTNGDGGCRTSGFVRERESLHALAMAGVEHQRVHFLGYPDGALDRLGRVPLAPTKRLDAAGVCVEATGTYAMAEDATQTVAMQRMGHESPYQLDALVTDLAWLFDRYRPRRIVTAHLSDDHPDHAATGRYVYRALEKASIAEPEVLLSVVHSGDDWPSPARAGSPRGERQPMAPTPPLPGALAGYVPDLRVQWSDSPPGLMSRLLGAYASQLGPAPETSWLQSFVRSDEVFFRSPFHCTDAAPRRCFDSRVSSEPPIDARGRGRRAWPAATSVSLRPGVGLRIDAAGEFDRLCLRDKGDAGSEILLHHFSPVERLTRRFEGVRLGVTRVFWVPEGRGAATLDLSDDAGPFGRRLVSFASPPVISEDPSCAGVP